MLTKCRQPGQGGTADLQRRDLRAQLLQAEGAHFNRAPSSSIGKRGADELDIQTQDSIEDTSPSESATEAFNAKRRRVLEETRDEDADENTSLAESSEDERLVYASLPGAICSSKLVKGKMKPRS